MTPHLVYVGGSEPIDEVADALEDADHEVAVARAVADVGRHLDRTDAVVTAASLPDGNALDVCNATPGIPVVVYARDPDASLASALFETDAADYVLREEVPPEDLSDRVVGALRRAAADSWYRRLVEAAGDFVYVVDDEGRFTTLNDAGVSISGYDREEIIGEYVSVLMDGTDIQQGEKAIQRLLHGDEETVTFEMDLHTKDGTVRRVENHVALLPMPDGEFHGTVGVLRDVTARKQRDERLRELHDMTRELFSAPDRDAVAGSTVRAAQTILGYPINGVRYLEDGKLVPVAMSDRVQALLGERPLYDVDGDSSVAESFRRGELLVSEDPSGVNVEPLAATCHLPLGEYGTLSIGALDGGFDDTDLMLARVLGANVEAALDRLERRAELAAERDRLSALFENIPDPAIYVEFEAGEPIVRDANPAFEATFGYDATTLLGESVDDFLVPAGKATEAGTYNEQIRAGSSIHGEVRRETVDGPRDFLLHVVPYEIGERTTRGFAIYTDITERKERERELERQNERLDRFASVVSHDLRNPLNVVVGRLELARETGDDEHFDAANRSLTRMEELVDGLLALARQGRMVGDREPVALDETVRAAWGSVETGEATLELRSLPTVSADGSRLGQLFENLFRNAVEHGSTGDVPTVTVGALEDGFFVADDGPGIADEEREQVFEFGYSGANGTGFGLAIVRGIAEAHGWELSLAESETGGARFEFTDVDEVESS